MKLLSAFFLVAFAALGQSILTPSATIGGDIPGVPPVTCGTSGKPVGYVFAQTTTNVLFACGPDGLWHAAINPASIAVNQLPNWRLAMGNAQSGVSDAKVLFIGDSTTWGAWG